MVWKDWQINGRLIQLTDYLITDHDHKGVKIAKSPSLPHDLLFPESLK